MNQNLAPTGPGDVLASVILHGDLSRLNDAQKVSYYMQFCDSLGLNPITQPFAIMKFKDGKEILYAKKEATEQLRTLKGISCLELTSETVPGVTHTVTCKLRDKEGKTDISTGVVALTDFKGELLRGKDLANAMMAAETKAKRRATLSISGLSMLDESEVATVDGAAVLVDIPINPKPTKQALSDTAFGKAMERIQNGEKDLIAKLRETYVLSQAQSDTLLSIEDANTVSA